MLAPLVHDIRHLTILSSHKLQGMVAQLEGLGKYTIVLGVP
jgi:hypothetical protein